MAFVKTVDRYAAFHYPNRSANRARINLYCKDGFKLYLLFNDDGKFGVNTYNEANKVGVAYDSINNYGYYIDLIRNEKPIYVTFRPEDTPPHYVVYVSGEEPGEGEMWNKVLAQFSKK